MKNQQPIKKEIGGYTFYIRPMSAMRCAYVSGELATVLVPLVTTLLPLAGGEEISDKTVVESAPAIAGAFSTLSGEKVQKLLSALLIEDGCIGVEGPDINGAVFLDKDTLNTVFAGNAQNMFILAFHVININFGDFFGTLGAQCGTAFEKLRTPMTASQSMAN